MGSWAGSSGVRAAVAGRCAGSLDRGTASDPCPPQDRLVQLPQCGPRVGTQLLRHPFADGRIAVQCLRAAPGVVQRPHQYFGQRFGQRILAQQSGQRADDGRGITEVQLGAGPADGGVLVLPPPGLTHPRRPLPLQAGQGFSAPQTECLAEQPHSCRVGPVRHPRLFDQVPEPVHVDLVRAGFQQVPARASYEA
jgi:hypothetical protein